MSCDHGDVGEDIEELAAAAALGASADRAPKRTEGCSFDVSRRQWLTSEQVLALPKNRLMMLLHGYEFQVQKARTSISTCKRCGQKFERGSMQVGYPAAPAARGSVGKRRPVAATVLLHLHCARRDRSLVEIALGGAAAMREKVLGYDALKKPDRHEFRAYLSGEFGNDEIEEAPRFPTVPAVRELTPRSAPAALRIALLPFQEEGLGWMLDREADASTRGGILADEMGMGKTLQTIALVLASPSAGPTLVVVPASGLFQWRSEIKRFASSHARRVKLYYGPNRSFELLRGFLKTAALDERKGDTRRTIILTSYQTLELEYRRAVARHCVRCQWCGESILPHRKVQHRRVCGKKGVRPQQPPPNKRMRMTSIEDGEEDSAGEKLEDMLEGLSLDSSEGEGLEEGEEEDFEEETQPIRDIEGNALVVKDADDGRSLEALEDGIPGDFDEAVATDAIEDIYDDLDYDDFEEDVLPLSAPPEATAIPDVDDASVESDSISDDAEEVKLDLSSSPLFKCRWARVILDEAHRIKGRSSSTASAASSLRVRSGRWCLSGTPVQNRVGELCSMVRFLRVHPYGYNFCAKRGCGCYVLRNCVADSTGVCWKCGHSRMLHRSSFACSIANPIRQFGFLGKGRDALERLRHEVIDKVLLRRTKTQRAADVHLPPVDVRIRRCKMSKRERKVYASVEDESQELYEELVRKGSVTRNFAHIFGMIMRRRQAACHPDLVLHSLGNQAWRKSSTRCALCFDLINDPTASVIASCGHRFHGVCIADYAEEAPAISEGRGAHIRCPMCPAMEGEASVDEVAAAAPTRRSSSLLQRIRDAGVEVRSSKKVNSMVRELVEAYNRDPSIRALVFSQFAGLLEIIEWRLQADGWRTAKLVGGTSVEERDAAVRAFQSEDQSADDPNVLLISLKVGGEGLNLQAANYVFLMDPWWNPAAEMQAVQRAHRIGQKRPVHVVRFVSVGTIEESILELQEKKQCVFDCTVGGSNVALQKLTGADIQILFTPH
eukprot:TRINITY_DN67222_c0_g1_i1.p1 TRINITY_DN67222_c0_g1~~TRINITY_DN67222_c0_g1_i1.p1  ORF type:complete len:1007 (+),score=209.45 TRINITY_DN67222_c0_g1_i1:91-3111(+)